jgi:hypothetical protein
MVEKKNLSKAKRLSISEQFLDPTKLVKRNLILSELTSVDVIDKAMELSLGNSGIDLHIEPASHMWVLFADSQTLMHFQLASRKLAKTIETEACAEAVVIPIGDREETLLLIEELGIAEHVRVVEMVFVALPTELEINELRDALNDGQAERRAY